MSVAKGKTNVNGIDGESKETGTPPAPRNKWTNIFAMVLGALLRDYKVTITTEHELFNEPMRIDILVVKVLEDTVIDNTVMRFFRKHNIVEFKGPSDTLNIWSFDRVLSYFHAYLSKDRVSFDKAAITFVSVRRPVKLLKVLREERGYKIIPSGTDGIYYIVVSGSSTAHVPAMQLVVNRELSAEDAEWIRNIRNDWTEKYGNEMLNKVDEMEDAQLREAMYSVWWANHKHWEGKGMRKLVPTEQFRQWAVASGMAEEWKREAWQEAWQKAQQATWQEATKQVLSFMESGHSVEEAKKKFAFA